MTMHRFYMASTCTPTKRSARTVCAETRAASCEPGKDTKLRASPNNGYVKVLVASGLPGCVFVCPDLSLAIFGSTAHLQQICRAGGGQCFVPKVLLGADGVFEGDNVDGVFDAYSYPNSTSSPFSHSFRILKISSRPISASI